MSQSLWVIYCDSIAMDQSLRLVLAPSVHCYIRGGSENLM